MKKFFILLLVGLLFSGLSSLYFEFQREEEKPVIVYIIDARFNPMFGPTNRIQRPGSYQLRPGHGQLVREIIEVSSGSSNLIIREKEIQPYTQVERRKQFEEFLREIYFEQSLNRNKRVIVNISLAFMERNQVEEELFHNLKELGIITIAAAGNSGDNYLYYPAAYDATVSITSGSKQGLADYATYNSKVDFAASGDVVSYLPGNINSFQVLTYRQAGTSFAAPRVSGLIAGILSRNPDKYQAYELIEMAKNNAKNINESTKLILSNNLLYNTDRDYFWRQLYLRVFLILLVILIFPSWYLLKYQRLLIKYRNLNNPEEYFAYFEKLNLRQEEKVKGNSQKTFEDKFDLSELIDYIKYIVLEKNKDPEKVAKDVARYVPTYSNKLITEYSFIKVFSKFHSMIKKKYKADKLARFWLELLNQFEEDQKAKSFIFEYIFKVIDHADPWLIYYCINYLMDLIEQGLLSENDITKINNELIKINKKKDPLIKEALIMWYNKIE